MRMRKKESCNCYCITGAIITCFVSSWLSHFGTVGNLFGKAVTGLGWVMAAGQPFMALLCQLLHARGLLRPSMATQAPPLRGFLSLTSFLGFTFFLLIIYFLFRHSLPEKWGPQAVSPEFGSNVARAPLEKLLESAPLWDEKSFPLCTLKIFIPGCFSGSWYGFSP